MKDFQIREILRKTELNEFLQDGHSKVVEELDIPVSGARIDMAVINGLLHGYEIKSASDTLQRLPLQLEAYTKVFDRITIVTEGKHYQRIIDVVPSWVGISICSEKGSEEFKIIQPARPNTNKQGFFVAKLLWRDEIMSLLAEKQIPFKKKHRNWILCETLAANMSISDLSNAVREKLKSRTNWKFKEDYASM